MHAIFLSRNHSNSSVSHRNQVFYQFSGALFVIHHHRWNSFLSGIAVSYHHRHRKLLGQNINQPLMRGYINDSFYLFGQQFLNFFFHDASILITLIIGILKFFVKTKVYQQNLIIFFFTIFRNSVNNIRQRKNRHVFCNHANTATVFCLQILCH